MLGDVKAIVEFQRNLFAPYREVWFTPVNTDAQYVMTLKTNAVAIRLTEVTKGI